MGINSIAKNREGKNNTLSGWERCSGFEPPLGTLLLLIEASLTHLISIKNILSIIKIPSRLQSFYEI